MLTVLGGLAEFERELIRARTGEGRERAKSRGVKMGRKPKLTSHQIREAVGRRDKGETVRDIARTYNVSHSTISRLATRPGWLAMHGQAGRSADADPSWISMVLSDWLASVVGSIRFGRAKGRCEHCRRPHSRLVFHLGDGRWWDEEAATWRNGRGRALSFLTQPPALGDDMVLTTKVVLATAHLDHNPSNNKTRNLKAYCQRCHMLHDREEHRRRRRIALRKKNALGDLFLGRYSDFS
jgi:hypothetical protein